MIDQLGEKKKTESIQISRQENAEGKESTGKSLLLYSR